MRASGLMTMIRSPELRRWRDQPRTPRQWTALSLWALFLFAYPFAVIGVAFDVRSSFSMVWAGSLLLILEGALAAAWFGARLGARRGGLIVGVVVIGSLAVETIGVNTGVPFGSYHYTAALFPRLPGGVPLPVAGAWLLVVAAAAATARFLAPHANLPARVALATSLGVALDVILEPVAVHVVNYWAWGATGPYEAIPTSNFLGWAAVCMVFTAVVAAVEPRGAPAARLDLPAVWLYALTAFMFGLIDLTHGLTGGAVIAALALGALGVARWRAKYDTL